MKSKDMAYSLDLRQRVINFIHKGGSKREAAKLYEVCETTIYAWLKRDDLRPTKVLRRRRKLDWKALANHVQQYPDAQLKERAAHFGVRPSAIHYALKQMKITRKKTAKVSRKKSSRTSTVLTRTQTTTAARY